MSSLYWSASGFASDPFDAWGAGFDNGNVFISDKTGDFFVRAVRAGTCD